MNMNGQIDRGGGKCVEVKVDLVKIFEVSFSQKISIYPKIAGCTLFVTFMKATKFYSFLKAM